MFVLPAHKAVVATIVLATCLLTPTTRMCVSAARSAPESEYVGNEACARCHSSIYRSYSAPAMAHASGLARENFIPADFVHANSAACERDLQEPRTDTPCRSSLSAG